jgi:hypothetical protein
MRVFKHQEESNPKSGLTMRIAIFRVSYSFTVAERPVF